MSKIPESVQTKPIEGLERINQGKVRDLYASPVFTDPGILMPVCTKRISIFDFVLPAVVEQKGEILNAMNIFWVTGPLAGFCEHDLVTFGGLLDDFLPLNLRNNPELQKIATIIRKLRPDEREDIVRLYLTGSAVKPYLKEKTVCGHRLPEGLFDGAKLPFALYTPTDKKKDGHDEHISADSVAAKYGHLPERLALQIAQVISAYAESRGIILADTKFEKAGNVLIDEKGTPDSSRYWEKSAWEKAVAKGKLPPSLDKQYVREWGKSQGIDKLDPTNPDHLKTVHSLAVPQNILDKTARIYRYIFWRLTGEKLETFQYGKMAINTPPLPLNIEIVIGSRSDLPQIEAGITKLEKFRHVKFNVSVISCHRNPEALWNYCQFSQAQKADIFIAGAGKAAALPGILKSNLRAAGYGDKPVIGVAFKGAEENDDQAAILSIENLPGQPVELNENGHAYFDSDGAEKACLAAVQNEFLPKETGVVKPHELNIKI